MFPFKFPVLCLSTAQLYHGEYGNCTTECRFAAHRMQDDIFSFSCMKGLRIEKALLGSKVRLNCCACFQY